MCIGHHKREKRPPFCWEGGGIQDRYAEIRHRPLFGFLTSQHHQGARFPSNHLTGGTMEKTELDKQFLKRLGNCIRSTREYSRLSQEELAEQLNPTYTAQHIAKLEVGFTDTSITELNRIALILDVPLNSFIDDGALFQYENERFFEAYNSLSEQSRSQVRKIVFALAGDDPLLHS